MIWPARTHSWWKHMHITQVNHCWVMIIYHNEIHYSQTGSHLYRVNGLQCDDLLICSTYDVFMLMFTCIYLLCFFWGYMSINVPYMEHHLESKCRRKELDKTLPWAQWWNCISKSAKKTKTKNFREFLLHQVLEWTRQQRPLHRSSVLAVSIPLFFMVAHPALGVYLEPNNVYRKSAKVNGKKDNPQHGKVEEQINEVYATYT